MKKMLASASLAAFATLVAAPLAASAAPETYPLDTYHTYPSFTVEHWQLSMMNGRFDKATGRFVLDRAAKTGSAEITIDAASLTTGDGVKGSRPQSRDDHLRSGDFFNVKEFPTITFKSTKVNFNGDQPASVEGNLTMVGVTKPVTLAFERFKCMANPFNKKDRCGGNLAAKVRRSDFGMKYGIPMVGDEIALHIEFEGDKE